MTANFHAALLKHALQRGNSHMRNTVWLTLAALASTASTVLAADLLPAKLAGHSILPAASFFAPPAGAPELFATTGKFAAPDRKRVDTIESVEGTSFLSAKEAPRKTGMKLPFKGQPYQGFSGIKSMGDGTFWTILDNGLGAKANSADAMLSLHQVKPDWATGTTSIVKSIFLRDPDGKLPFLITTEGSKERYLTGADLDVESFQPIGNSIWIGDEFGPYLIEVDQDGKVLSFFETDLNGTVAKSPDHFTVSTPAKPGDPVAFNIRRSRGYEGMAASPDGRFLYPLLEGPVWDETAKSWEMQDGKEVLRVLEFDVAAKKWTGRHWTYALEANGNNIGDFNMIDATTGLVIERDNGEGDTSMACAEGKIDATCFNTPATFKRVYKVELGEAKPVGVARKIASIDLLAIADPDRKAKTQTTGDTFSFPFVTIESVDVVDSTHIIVGNDNNLPYSSGRTLGKQDDNELILLAVPELLSAK
jgi:hypothetical protein